MRSGAAGALRVLPAAVPGLGSRTGGLGVCGASGGAVRGVRVMAGPLSPAGAGHGSRAHLPPAGAEVPLFVPAVISDLLQSQGSLTLIITVRSFKSPQ